jgi:antitoxin ParD1/3/4
MSRQSITLSDPNDKWLKKMVSSKEYSSKSELVNDLIRQARNQQVQIKWISKKLKAAEKAGFTDMTSKEILDESKKRLNAKL